MPADKVEHTVPVFAPHYPVARQTANTWRLTVPARRDIRAQIRLHHGARHSGAVQSQYREAADTMKLRTLKPRVGTLGTRLQTAQVTYGYDRTERIRGRKWMQLRAAWLRQHPLCAHCDAVGRTSVGTEVDHIRPLWQGGLDDESNYQSLCHACHEAKTAREATERGRGIDVLPK